jgi:hypothetical protein
MRIPNAFSFDREQKLDDTPCGGIGIPVLFVGVRFAHPNHVRLRLINELVLWFVCFVYFRLIVLAVFIFLF